MLYNIDALAQGGGYPETRIEEGIAPGFCHGCVEYGDTDLGRNDDASVGRALPRDPIAEECKGGDRHPNSTSAG